MAVRYTYTIAFVLWLRQTPRVPVNGKLWRCPLEWLDEVLERDRESQFVLIVEDEPLVLVPPNPSSVVHDS